MAGISCRQRKRHVPAEPRSCAIARAIVALAHSLGIQVLAEGVETAEQAGFLQDADCEALQGYFCCRPMPAEQLTRWLQERGVRAVK